MKELEKRGYIITDADGLDWAMHQDTKQVLKTDKSNDQNSMFKYLPRNKEYMVVRNYYKDDKEYEFSIILKDKDCYYFITDVPREEVNE